jgi:gluconate 2-dehydrogenase gamma chain
VSQDSAELLKRREILRRAAWLLGGAISAPAALAILQGCSARQQDSAAPSAALKLLNPAQFDLVAGIAEIMLPKTDTAGAREAGVPAFIDAALAGIYPQEAQARFQAGCDEFEAAIRKSGKSFQELDAAERTALVKLATEAALAADHDPKPFILMTRELTLLGYFSSQVGITENMEYVPVPTAFHGCVPLSQMKKHVYWE